jgi:hypothetical protein
VLGQPGGDVCVQDIAANYSLNRYPRTARIDAGHSFHLSPHDRLGQRLVQPFQLPSSATIHHPVAHADNQPAQDLRIYPEGQG